MLRPLAQKGHEPQLYPIDVTWSSDSEHSCHLSAADGNHWLVSCVCVGMSLVTLSAYYAYFYKLMELICSQCHLTS